MRTVFKFIISLLVLICINSECISNSNPVNATDCTMNNDIENYCCMLSSPGYSPSSKTCTKIAISNYFGQNIMIYNNLTYNLNCGNPPLIPVKGRTCGNPLPLFKADCWEFSNLEMSCCYYLSQNTTGTSGCQWLGEKKMGSALNSEKLLLSCNENYLKFSLIMLLISLVFIM